MNGRGGESSPDTSGLPADALVRLADSEEDAPGATIFTSDLSVNEFLLIKEAGFRPRGLVFGSSIFHIGYQRRGLRSSKELGSFTQAMYTARELAMARMEEEAKILGADGVVAVRTRQSNSMTGEDTRPSSSPSVRRSRHRTRRSGVSGTAQAVHQRPVRPGLLDPRPDRLCAHWDWCSAPVSTEWGIAGRHQPPRPSCGTRNSPTSPRPSTKPGSWP